LGNLLGRYSGARLILTREDQTRAAVSAQQIAQ